MVVPVAFKSLIHLVSRQVQNANLLLAVTAEVLGIFLARTATPSYRKYLDSY